MSVFFRLVVPERVVMLQERILTHAHTGRTIFFFKAHEVKRLSGGSHRRGRKDVVDHSALYKCVKFPNKLKKCRIVMYASSPRKPLTSLFYILHDPMEIGGNQFTQHKFL